MDARIQWALHLSKDYLQGLPAGAPPRTSVDDHVNWLKSRPGYKPGLESAYREARSLEQVRVAEDLRELYTTAGVFVVDALVHGIIPAKIGSTDHVTVHTLMHAELGLRVQ